MNTESPLIPRGSLLEQKNKSRKRFKIAFVAGLCLHGVALLALLMAGCNRNTETTPPVTGGSPGSEPSRQEPPPSAPSAPLPSLESSNTASGLAGVTPGTTGAPPSTAPLTGTTTGATATVETTPLPGSTPSVGTPAPAPGGVTDYKVVKNDTLGKIAKRSHVTLTALKAANPGVDSTKLKIDQVIHIPAPSTPTAAGSSTAAPGGVAPGTAPAPDVAGGEQVYTVKSGDSLIKIAHDFGVGVKALRAANALKTDRIRVSQKLKIPAKTAATTAAPGTGGASASGAGTGAPGTTPLTPMSGR